MNFQMSLYVTIVQTSYSKLHSKLLLVHTSYIILHSSSSFSLHLYFKLDSSEFKLHSSHFTLLFIVHTLHFIFHASYFIVQTSIFILNTLYSKSHTLHFIVMCNGGQCKITFLKFTVHTLPFILHTS